MSSGVSNRVSVLDKEEFGSIENMMKTYPIGGLFIPWWDYLAHRINQ